MIISNRLTSLVLMLLIVSSIAGAGENSWTLVEGGPWKPSEKILVKIQARLEPYMKAQGLKVGRPLKPWNTYRFQYQGQDEKGNKFVYINAFCKQFKPAGIDLKKQFIAVFDGGSCFFQLKYDTDKDHFYDVFINGEA